MNVRARYRLGVDVGGTFVDLVLADLDNGDVRTLKVPTRKDALSDAVLDGLKHLLEREHIAPGQISGFVHGTTLATNTVIERTGAPVGLLVTRGTRDVLELGRLRLSDPTNFLCDKPVPLVPRRRVAEVSGRLLASGAEREPLNDQQVVDAVTRLTQRGAEAIAVCFLHSYVNPAHEQQARRAIEAAFPDLYVCLSSDVWPQQREYERALVAIINALLGRRIRAYLTDLTRGLADACLSRRFLCTRSNGGVMAAAEAAEHPVHLLLSGPAAGVVGAAYLGHQAGEPRLLTLDIGGTSADVAVVAGKVPYSSEGRVGDYPVLLPTVDVLAIGAGGGSVAWVDAAGLLKVGPHSVGSEPGPASYGRGGQSATVTDAYVVAGILDRFLGGSLPLDANAASAALERLGERLGLSTVEAAWAVLDVTTSAMHARILPFLAARGVAARELALYAYGGAGPTHAFLLARELDVPRVIVPPNPGALCALGCLVADVRVDFIRSVALPCDDHAMTEVEHILAELAARGRAWIGEQAAEIEQVAIVRTADMRYVGQSFDVPVPIPEAHGAAALKAAFEHAYETIFLHRNATAAAEIVNLRVQVVGLTPKPRNLRPAPPPNAASPPRPTRLLHLPHGREEARVVDRYALKPGDAFDGPAIVEQYDTTVFVPAGYGVHVDDLWQLVGTWEGARGAEAPRKGLTTAGGLGGAAPPGAAR